MIALLAHGPQLLPWQEQLRLRRVCRTWLAAVHERLDAPVRFPDEALPALMRCHLHTLVLDCEVPIHLLAALPTSLRSLRAPHNDGLSGLQRLSRLQDLSLGELSKDDVELLGAMSTLTRLKVLAVAPCGMESTARAVAGLSRLQELTMLHGESDFVETMLLNGPATLTRVTLKETMSDVVEAALLQTPLRLDHLALPHAVPLPVEQWPWLRTLRLGECEADSDTCELLQRISTLPGLRSLQLHLLDAHLSQFVGALTMLESLNVSVEHGEKSRFLAVQLPRLVYLTALHVGQVIFDSGQLRLLQALSRLQSLELQSCRGDGIEDVAWLHQLRHLAVLECPCFDASTVPNGLDSLTVCLATGCDDALNFDHVTCLRRLELRDSGVGYSEPWRQWHHLTHLEEVVFVRDDTLPSTVVAQLAAMLPALRRVVLEYHCAPVDEPSPLSRVRLVVR